MLRNPLKLMANLSVLLLVTAAVVVTRDAEVRAATRAVKTKASEVSAPVHGTAVFPLEFAAQHVAVHWPGHHDALVDVAFSVDGIRFGTPVPVPHDEVGEGHPSGETFGAVLGAGGATHVRVSVDRPIGRMTVLALADGEHVDVAPSASSEMALDGVEGVEASIIPRSGWGADESLRLRGGKEIWPAEFHRVQKLIVHHTATGNGYTDPAAEIRAIYYYHAVTQRWGDIGYNFIVDSSGTLYKGRWSGEGPQAADTLTGEDSDRRIVTAGHTFEHNVGTVGVAVLGTLTDPNSGSPDTGVPGRALDRIVEFLTWEAERHSLNPKRPASYRNVVNGVVAESYNVAGHRDYNVTACPGEEFYKIYFGPLSSTPLRDDVFARLSDPEGDVVAPAPVVVQPPVSGRRTVTLNWTAATEDPATESGVAYYEIWRASSPGGPFTAVKYTDERVTTVTDSGLRGVFYYYVTVVDGAGNRSSASNVVEGTPK